MVVASLYFLAPAKQPLPMSELRVPAFYHRIANDGGNYAIIDFPFLNCYRKKYFYYQTVHRKSLPLVITRPNWFTQHAPNSLEYPCHEPSETVQAYSPNETGFLASVGFRYLVLHVSALNNRGLPCYVKKFALTFDEPVYTDKDIIVFDLKRRAD